MKKTYRHLFFDLDHTLWDFEENSARAWRQLYDEYHLAERGLPDFDAFLATYNVHNDRLWERFRNGQLKREELRWKRVWLTLLDFKLLDSALTHELSTAYLEILPAQHLLMPYAREILDHCRERYTMHLITNGFEATQRQKLQYSGIGHYFNEIITSEKSSSMKPHPEIFDYALRTTGALLEESLMIGDALEIDIVGAMNAGWDQVYYNPERKPHSRKPTYEIAHFEELKGIL